MLTHHVLHSTGFPLEIAFNRLLYKFPHNPRKMVPFSYFPGFRCPAHPAPSSEWSHRIPLSECHTVPVSILRTLHRYVRWLSETALLPRYRPVSHRPHQFPSKVCKSLIGAFQGKGEACFQQHGVGDAVCHMK